MNVVNNVAMSSLRAPWQNGRTQTKTHNNTKTRRTPRRNRHSEITIKPLGLWTYIIHRDITIIC